MKLIEQLVHYLRSRGALSPEQLSRLAGKGFIEPPAEDDAPPTRAGREDDRDWDALYPEQIPVRPARKGRGRGARPVGKQTTPEELAVHLAERFPTWEKELQGLSVLVRRFGPCPGWRAAAISLGKRSSEELSVVLTAALCEGPLTADLLWDALHFEAYRDGVDYLTGRVGNAYRALLSGGDVSEFAKHNWLLKYDEPAAVYRLIRAQRTIARALPAVYHESPELIRRGLRHGEYARPLALLEAARWAATDPRSFHAKPLRYFILRPGDADWWPAWSLALQIDPAGAAALLAHCQVDPFTATPADRVPGELIRFTRTAEEIFLRSDPDMQAAWDQVFGDAHRGRPEVMRAAVRHSIRAIALLATCHPWQVEAAEYEPLLLDPQRDVREYAGRTLLAAPGPDWRERPRAGAVLVEALASPDAHVRRDALRLLLRIVDAGHGVPLWPKTRPALAAALAARLADADDAAAADAARALWPVAGSDAVPLLQSQLDHPAAVRRFAAAATLWRSGRRSASYVPILMEAAEAAARAEERREALAALGDFGEAAVPALPVLIRALNGETGPSAARALERLGTHAAAAVPDMVRVFTSDAPVYLRENLGKALQAMPPTAVWPHLGELILFEQKYSTNYFGPMAREVLRPFVERTGTAVGAAVRALADPNTTEAAASRLWSERRRLAEGLPRLVALALDEAGSPAGRLTLDVLNALGAQACPAVAALTHAPGSDAAALRDELGRLAVGLMPHVLRGLRDAGEANRAAAAAVLQWVGPVAAVQLSEEAK